MKTKNASVTVKTTALDRAQALLVEPLEFIEASSRKVDYPDAKPTLGQGQPEANYSGLAQGKPCESGLAGGAV